MSLDLNQAFGTILAAYRNLEGLSQEDFEGAAHRTYVSDLERGLKSPTIEMISKLSERLKVHPTELVAQTFALLKTGSMRSLRPSIPYLQNRSSSADFSYTSSGKNFTPEEVEKSVVLTNMTVSSLATIFYQVADVNLFDVIDKKQTGSFLGSIFVSNFAVLAADHLAKNPSQTGHPDLIPKQYLNDPSIKNWDQFPYGGVEVKTSCGDMKTGVTQNLPIGQPRISYLQNIAWKGHHQHINNLLALFWDYFEERPTIFATFYSNRLIPDDFTLTIPKEGGGRTTSVCVTKVSARNKLMKNWVLLPNIPEYKRLFLRLGASHP